MSSRDAKRVRHKARRRLAKLIKAQHGKCAYCSREIVHFAELQRRGLVIRRVGGQRVEFKANGGMHIVCLVASVDHKLEIKRGGDNRFENLVASCIPCNTTRDRTPSKYDPMLCRKCGQPKEDPHKRKCNACRTRGEIKKTEIFREHRERHEKPTHQAPIAGTPQPAAEEEESGQTEVHQGRD